MSRLSTRELRQPLRERGKRGFAAAVNIRAGSRLRDFVPVLAAIVGPEAQPFYQPWATPRERETPRFSNRPNGPTALRGKPLARWADNRRAVVSEDPWAMPRAGRIVAPLGNFAAKPRRVAQLRGGTGDSCVSPFLRIGQSGMAGKTVLWNRDGLAGYVV